MFFRFRFWFRPKVKNILSVIHWKKAHCSTYIYDNDFGWICSVALKSWFCVKWTLLTISRNLELASTKPEIWAQVSKQPISLPIEIQIHYSATMTKVLLLWLDTHIYPQWSQSLSEIVFEVFCDFAISQCNLSTILFYNHGYATDRKYFWNEKCICEFT